jgi:tRNA G18 (ribose-2'-O)-methylase SpoU
METITGIKHSAYRDAQALLRQSERERTGCYLLETANFVLQALQSSAEIVSVFALPQEAKEMAPLCAARGAPLYVLGSGLMNRLVGTGYEVSVTAMAVVRQRTLSEETLPTSGDSLILAGERIQDPRNVGVLIRTAEAAGCFALLLSADSAEPCSRASVRSTTGSIVRLPVCLVSFLPDTLNRLRSKGVMVAAGSAHAPRFVYDAPLASRPLVVLVGNESEGLTREALEATDERVALPMAAGGPSSLNVTVAAGALLYEAIRQRLSAKPSDSIERNES